MKKTTLNKLIQQALREVIRESNDVSLSSKYTTENKKLTFKEKSGIQNDLLHEQIDREKEESPINVAGFSNKRIKEIYNFLVKNSKEKVLLEEIADNPLLKRINIDGLGVIYPQFSTILFEELKQLLPELLGSGLSCSSLFGNTNNPTGIVNYGSIDLHRVDCSAVTINDKFICCSIENPTPHAPGGSTLYALNYNPTNHSFYLERCW